MNKQNADKIKRLQLIVNNNNVSLKCAMIANNMIRLIKLERENDLNKIVNKLNRINKLK
jgi:hypothetical protein